MRKRVRKLKGAVATDAENVLDEVDDEIVDQVLEEEDEEPVRRYHLTHIIRENATRPIVRVSMKRIGDEASNDPETCARSLILTVGGDQANVYEGKYLDLASHFVHAPNEHVPAVGEIKTSCWIESDPDKNDALFALGASDGIISIVSLAASRVIRRLGSENQASGKSIVDLVAHPQKRFIIASLVQDTKNGNNSIEMWNTETGELVGEFALPGKAAYETVSFVPACERETLACTRSDEVVFFETGGKEIDCKKLPGKTISIIFLGNSEDVLLLTSSGGAMQYNLRTKEKKLPFPKTVKFASIATTADSRFIASGDDRGGAYVVDLQTGDAFALRSHKTKAMTVTTLAFTSPDAKHVVCASNDGALWRWIFRDTTQMLPCDQPATTGTTETVQVMEGSD